MNERTVNLPTIDIGPVTVPEPAWCAGHEPVPQYRVDIHHMGPERPLTFQGEPLGSAYLVQAPYGAQTFREPLGHVSLMLEGASLDPAGLDELAAALVDHAATIRRLARELAVVLGSAQ